MDMSPLDPTAAVSVRGLTKRYGSNDALRGVDLDVAPGEVVALLGPNGAGKTTLVEILEGYRDRSGGSVAVLGEDPEAGDLDWRSRLGVVLQSPNSFDELTVEEIVSHIASYFPRRRSVHDTIELVGLAEKRSARARHLSGGQRRRLDVALAIVGRPDLVFLDEPTTGFDPEARRAFWELIRSLAAGGTTIVLTTHYLDEAEALADRVGVLVRGEIVAIAAPDELGGERRHGAEVGYLDDTGPVVVRTEAPTRLVRELAARFGGEVPGLSVRRPSLEDVYLTLLAEHGTATDAARADDASADDAVVVR
jgi:ABC-2 type transport system ATP-binding protein